MKVMTFFYDINFPDYRDKKGKAVPITKIFPQVACLILPGQTEKENFAGDLSQVKHLTLFDSVEEGSPTFPKLESLEVRKYSSYYDISLPMPSKRLVVPEARIEWRILPRTMEVIEARFMFHEYISVGKPHFEHLKILTGAYGKDPETLMNFLKDHKESLTELSLSIAKEVAAIKDLIPLFTSLQKLSVKIKTDKQAIELKEVKALAHNLQYFELSFYCGWETEEKLGAILENLPLGLDNLSIEDVTSYGEIDTFIEKIVEKIVNGDTKRVTIVGVECDDGDTTYIMEKISEMKPMPVRVEKMNTRVHEGDHSDSGSRTDYSKSICDIVISL